ncbi:MAG: putative cwfJ family protein [Streblomastix strix]|uniref:Putative cwfJ family protein n=1 Tax=Streblomastix strix TaxID=222440 RepID=A0A5J4X9T7_9EUKA|nr:MAG: putative cwfJ family protein [Streblomastix strix]
MFEIGEDIFQNIFSLKKPEKIVQTPKDDDEDIILSRELNLDFKARAQIRKRESETIADSDKEIAGNKRRRLNDDEDSQLMKTFEDKIQNKKIKNSSDESEKQQSQKINNDSSHKHHHHHHHEKDLNKEDKFKSQQILTSINQSIPSSEMAQLPKQDEQLKSISVPLQDANKNYAALLRSQLQKPTVQKQIQNNSSSSMMQNFNLNFPMQDNQYNMQNKKMNYNPSSYLRPETQARLSKTDQLEEEQILENRISSQSNDGKRIAIMPQLDYRGMPIKAPQQLQPHQSTYSTQFHNQQSTDLALIERLGRGSYGEGHLIGMGRIKEDDESYDTQGSTYGQWGNGDDLDLNTDEQDNENEFGISVGVDKQNIRRNKGKIKDKKREQNKEKKMKKSQIGLNEEQDNNESNEKYKQNNEIKLARQVHKMDELIDSNCYLCSDSQYFRRDLVIALGNYAYLALPGKDKLVDGHCIISPITHFNSSLQSDQECQSEIEKFKSSIRNLFRNWGQRECLFMECCVNTSSNMPTSFNQSKTQQQIRSAISMNHCVIDCIPIDPSFSKQAPAYYKKELSEAESDWTDNKSIINIPKGKLLRNCIPKQLPFFHVEFADGTGYGHIIEDKYKIRRDFGKEILIGAMNLTQGTKKKLYSAQQINIEDNFDQENDLNTIIGKPSKSQQQYQSSKIYTQDDVKEFIRRFKPFDWTTTLDDQTTQNHTPSNQYLQHSVVLSNRFSQASSKKYE